MKRLAAVLAPILLLSGVTLTAQTHRPPSGKTVSFSKPVISSLGDYPYLEFIAAGDINNDGIADLAVMGMTVGVPSYSLGNGTGAFPAWSIAPGGAYSGSILLADVNGDGNLDLLTCDSTYTSLTIAFGDGHGNFPSSEQVYTSYLSGTFVVADMNGDGTPDIVGLDAGAGQEYPGGVDVLLGKGNGQFQPEMLSGSGGAEPWALAVADLNHDGIPDVVVANIGDQESPNHKPYGSVTVLLGRGNGKFLPPVRYFAGDYPNSVALGDFNGDGNIDIAVTTGGGVSILLGDGTGAFSSPTQFFAGQYADSIVVADFNGDGIPDLAMITGRMGHITVLLGNGDGTFQPPQHFPVSGDAYQLVVGDFNGDGKPDLATLDFNDVFGKVFVLLNTTP